MRASQRIPRQIANRRSDHQPVRLVGQRLLEAQPDRPLVDKLDADDYQIRQAATKRLEAKIEQFRELLVAAANDQDASFEKRARIKFLLDKDSLDSVESDGLISSLRLLDDPQYLAIIMQELGEDDCKPIAHRLEQLTGEAFGTDVDAWRRWLAKAEAKQAIGID